MLQQLSAEHDLAPWFDADDLAEILGTVEQLPTEGLTDADDVPEAPTEPITKPGDLWILGNHRLLCGDSTDVLAVERLMDGQKADMVFTDPPYGMFLNTDYDAMFAADKAHRKTGKRFDEVAGDHEDFAPELINTIFTAFPSAKEVFVWGADYFSELIPDRKDGSWIVWDKRTNENMDRVSGNTFELCWSKQKHKRLIARIMWSGHHGMQKDDTKTRVHPTQKPVELVTWFFNNWGKETITVADLFGGSGSTLIACEKTSRHCRMMELDPAYCDVIVQRWQAFTGKLATLEENKEVF
jgi:DNA modification methylase